VNLGEKIKIRIQGVKSMEIFYRKRLWRKYSLFVNYLVLMGIKLILLTRIIKTFLEWLIFDLR